MDSLSLTPASPQTSAPSSTSSSSSLSTDFETFLVMLTAQMENQDPLNPLDSQDFATQLATFSGVEQQVKTNDLLSALNSQLLTSGMGDMASWVGMEARMATPAYFDGSPVEIVANPIASTSSNAQHAASLSIPTGHRSEAAADAVARSEGPRILAPGFKLL